MQNSFKDKGIEYIKRALDEDKKSNFEEAFKMYTTGLDYFRLHIKYEKNERIKETIEEKVSAPHLRMRLPPLVVK